MSEHYDDLGASGVNMEGNEYNEPPNHDLSGTEHPEGTDHYAVPVEHVTYNEHGDPVEAPDASNFAFGHPDQDSEDWRFQGKNGLCGPESIAMVVNNFGLQLDGQELTAHEVSQWAISHGDMIKDGSPSSTDLGYSMQPEQIHEVLDHFGVPSHLETGQSLESLEHYLGEGREVVLAIDAHRVWHDIPEGQDPGQMNHAVVLTGIDPHTGYAYLNDPGTPDGKMEAVPIRELMSAWSASHNTAIVTDHIPEDHVESPPVSRAPEPGRTEWTPGPVLLPVLLNPDHVQPVEEPPAAAPSPAPSTAPVAPGAPTQEAPPAPPTNPSDAAFRVDEEQFLERENEMFDQTWTE